MLKKSLFNIDGNPFYEGYTNGNHWNGFACPSFTKEVCKKICEGINALGYDFQKAYYDEYSDAFIVTDTNCIENDNPKGIQEEAQGHDIETEDGILHLYSLGSYNWIWDDIAERFDTPEECVLYYLRNCVDLPMSVMEDAYDDITERCFTVTGKPKIIDVPEYIDEYLRR